MSERACMYVIQPCGKPVAAAVEGRHYCDTHALATGKVRLVDKPVKSNEEEL